MLTRVFFFFGLHACKCVCVCVCVSYLCFEGDPVSLKIQQQRATTVHKAVNPCVEFAS